MDLKLHLKIVGLIKSHTFHVAKHIAEKLKLKFPKVFLDPEVQPFLELDWHAYLCWKKRELHGEVWQDSSSLMCLLNGIPLGDEQELASWAENQWSLTVAQPVAFFMVEAGDSYTKHLKKTGHQFVFMDIQIAGEAAGRLLFELFSDICPKTSKNFEALCTGELGQSSSGFLLCYKGSVFHRVVPNGWIQGGDISPERKGDGGESIYGPTFEDESFAVPHSRRGILGMANKGSHTNGSQFYITLRPSPWMDRTFVAFGRVVEGVDTLRRLETALTCNERPKYDCKVTDCGVLKC